MAFWLSSITKLFTYINASVFLISLKDIKSYEIDCYPMYVWSTVFISFLVCYCSALLPLSECWSKQQTHLVPICLESIHWSLQHFQESIACSCICLIVYILSPLQLCMSLFFFNECCISTLKEMRSSVTGCILVSENVFAVQYNVIYFPYPALLIHLTTAD